VHDTIPRAGAGDYDCSKGAQHNLTRALALELAELKINVNNIGPGMVLTPFNEEAVEDPSVREQQVQSIPGSAPRSRGRSAGLRSTSPRPMLTTSPARPSTSTVA
jgi:glucose 1-dehydrogenase